MTTTLTFAPFEPAHLVAAHVLSQAVGWPHRTEDWAMLLDLGRGVVALDGDSVVGTAFAANFGADVSATFMIIVSATHQGRGIGRKLMQETLPATGCCRLVATAEGLPLYEKLGFKVTGQTLQLQGLLSAFPANSLAEDPPMPIRKALPEDLMSLIALENGDFGGDRGKLMHWLFENGIVFIAQNADGQINGYSARRSFGRGQVIGPVVAPDAQTAKALILAAADGQDGQFIRLDTDEAAGLVAWIEGLGLTSVGVGHAMQRGIGPAPHDRFALFSQALG